MRKLSLQSKMSRKGPNAVRNRCFTSAFPARKGHQVEGFFSCGVCYNCRNGLTNSAKLATIKSASHSVAVWSNMWECQPVLSIPSFDSLRDSSKMCAHKVHTIVRDLRSVFPRTLLVGDGFPGICAGKLDVSILVETR
jgi:hypothetical protein